MSRIQPLDAGIIMFFKRHYKTKAWKKVLSKTVHNCFQNTGILPVNPDNDDDSNDDDIEILNINDGDVELIKELQESEIHEVLSSQEIVNLTTNPELEEDKSDKNNDSTEIQNMIKHCQAYKKQLENYEVQLSD
ncbi:16869_t:CDS:2, partial [Dentiscutata erythropus]